MKAFAALTLAAAALTLSAPASAQFAKAEDAIKYRQSALFVMGQHFGRLGAMANGRAPFDAKLEAETVKLAAAAKTGNLDNLKTAFGATAGTCKACHDNFRAK